MLPDLRNESTTFRRLAYFSFFCADVLGLHLLAHLDREPVDVDALQQLLDRLGAHLRLERGARCRSLLARLAELLLVEQLVLLQLGVARIDDDVGLEVEDALEIAQRDVEQVADAARQPLEEPHVADRGGERDVAEAFAAHLGLRDFDAALVADHAAVLHALVLAAEAFPVGDRAEDLGAEQAVAFRLERAVVDRLRLGDFAVRPRQDLFRRRQADPDRVEVAASAPSVREMRVASIYDLLQNGLRSALPAGFLLRLHQLDVQTERLELADQHVERLRQPGGERASPLTIAS